MTELKHKMTELKPCPFCGGEAEVYDYEASQDIYDGQTLGYLDTEYYTAYGCGCAMYGCIIGEKKSEEDAIEAWNRRAGETK